MRQEERFARRVIFAKEPAVVERLERLDLIGLTARDIASDRLDGHDLGSMARVDELEGGEDPKELLAAIA